MSTEPSQLIFISAAIFFLSLVCQGTSFTLTSNVFLPAAQAAVASGDLNEDGHPDLIIGGEPVGNERGKIRVLLGTGNGTFGAPTEYVIGINPASPSDYPYVQAIKVADLDGDGNLDVIVAHNGEASETSIVNVFVTVLFGESNGRLQPGSGYSFRSQTSNILVNSIDFGDFNNDGRKDVVLACQTGDNLGNIFFLKNNGRRHFESVSFSTVGANLYQVAAADFNDDSVADLIVTTRQEGIIILYGNNNFFFPVGDYEQRDIGIPEYGLVVKDFNADGKMDFAVVEKSTNHLRVFLKGAGGFLATPIVYETAFAADFLNSTDLNGDGRADLIIFNYPSGQLQIFYGGGDGTFGNAETINTNLPISNLAFDDFDGNGKTDIAFSFLRDPPASQAEILLNSPRRTSVSNDFDGDGKSDVAVFRPANGAWYLNQSTNGFTGITFGFGTDKLVPADYDGDGKTDLAVYRNGTWYVQRSSLGFYGVAFGDSNDIPVPADFDGDGKADLAVFRPSNGTWYLLQSTAGFAGIAFGQTGDKPVAADYDGDGKADVAVNRSGTWYINRSQLGFYGIQFGDANDKLVPADYDGDGKTDIAVFRPSNGTWYLQQSANGFAGIAFGLGTDLPVPADYDGDGKADVGVFRNGTWYLNRSSQGFFGVAFGASTDQPLPNVFVR